jgi:hypothetical protein
MLPEKTFQAFIPPLPIVNKREYPNNLVCNTESKAHLCWDGRDRPYISEDMVNLMARIHKVLATNLSIPLSGETLAALSIRVSLS